MSATESPVDPLDRRADRKPNDTKGGNGNRLPPHSREAEEHVLACCLVEGDDGATLRRATEAGLTEGSFYLPQTNLIFSTLRRMHAEGKALTQEILSHELGQVQFNEIGGWPYLHEITGEIPTTAHAGYFIDRLVRLDAQRKSLVTAANLAAAAQSFNGTAAEFSAMVAGFAKSLAQTQAPGSVLLDRLEARRLKASAPPPEPITRLYLAGKPIATPGNLVALIARSKTGKTAGAGAMIAAAVAASLGHKEVDTLRFAASHPEGKALVLLDTEQSPHDAHLCYMRALKRAGTELDPPWLHPHALAGYSPDELRKVLRPKLAQAHKANGGIFAVVLDGVADFVFDPNDPKECNPFVAELHALAIEYACPIICIIHSNEGKMAGDDGRGHLGKQLTRKAESNLLLKKVGDVTTITSEKQRKAPITEADGVAFKWSDDEGRHVACEAPVKAKEAQKKTDLRDLANEVFGVDKTVRRMELEKRIGDARNLKGNTPGRRVDAMKRLGVIQNLGLGLASRIQPAPARRCRSEADS